MDSLENTRTLEATVITDLPENGGDAVSDAANDVPCATSLNVENQSDVGVEGSEVLEPAVKKGRRGKSRRCFDKSEEVAVTDQNVVETSPKRINENNEDKNDPNVIEKDDQKQEVVADVAEPVEPPVKRRGRSKKAKEREEEINKEEAMDEKDTIEEAVPETVKTKQYPKRVRRTTTGRVSLATSVKHLGEVEVEVRKEEADNEIEEKEYAESRAVERNEETKDVGVVEAAAEEVEISSISSTKKRSRGKRKPKEQKDDVTDEIVPAKNVTKEDTPNLNETEYGNVKKRGRPKKAAKMNIMTSNATEMEDSVMEHVENVNPLSEKVEDETMVIEPPSKNRRGRKSTVNKKRDVTSEIEPSSVDHNNELENPTEEPTHKKPSSGKRSIRSTGKSACAVVPDTKSVSWV